MVREYYIDNIYQINFSTLIFKLNKPNSIPKELVIEFGRRIHLTKYSTEKPFKPPQFCTLLRKYLLNNRIQIVEQPDFERIAIIRTASKYDRYNLIIELFGKGNIILTDNENKIIHASSYRKMRDRSVIRGETIKPPPQKGLDPQKIGLAEFSQKIKETHGQLRKVLGTILSVSAVYAEEFLKLAGVKNITCEDITTEMIGEIWKAVLLNLNKRENPQPCIIYNNQNLPVNIVPFPLTIYNDYRFEYYPTLNDAFDEYFTKKIFEQKNEKSSK